MTRTSRFFTRRSAKEGLAPGTLVHIGERPAHEVTVTLFSYGPEDFHEQVVDVSVLQKEDMDKEAVTWLDVDGLHRPELIEPVGNVLELHPLVLEDVVNTGQRPKFEDYAGYVFLVVRMLDYDQKAKQVTDEQLAVVLGPNWVLTFQERPGDVFEPVRNRIRTGKGRIRRMGADYLAYCLIDAVVDHYFSVLELLGDQLEQMSDEIMGQPDQRLLKELHGLRQELLVLRRAAWPLRSMIHRMQQGQSELITDETGVFIRDAYDHTVQIIDTSETLREMTTDLRDIYLSNLSNRMNETMKVLTVIATVFIPLTFIAGVYGMNFAFMPELSWRYGYATILGLMALVAGGLVLFFKRRRWI